MSRILYAKDIRLPFEPSSLLIVWHAAGPGTTIYTASPLFRLALKDLDSFNPLLLQRSDQYYVLLTAFKYIRFEILINTSTIKALFIVRTDAHSYKIIGILKQLKFWQLLRHISVHEIAPWWWFLSEPKHVGAIVGILIVLTFLWL